MPLDRSPRFKYPDAVYAAIVDAHRGLDASQSAALNARLVLLLANHIGDDAVIVEALRAAAGGQLKRQ
ncbi:MAG: DUF2783 domain-containing protein [Hyphomicrobiaceae bacterium]